MSSIGAPKKSGKSSRKTKASWRKAVDISDITSGLEEKRAEERVTGSAVAGRANEDLFMIDVKGDEDVARPKPPKKLLKSQQILAERSSHPAIFSRTASSTPAHLRPLSHDEKDRLRRIARKDVKGPFGAVVERDPSAWGSGSALFNGREGLKEYDPWTGEGGLALEKEAEVGEWDRPRTFVQKKVKQPRSLASVKKPAVPAVPLPASGQSYNPSYESHQELLRKAHEVEAQRVREEERVREIKERMAKARKDGKEMGGVEMEGGEYAEGMRVEILEEDEEMEAPVEEEMVGEDGEELTEAQKQEKREQARQPNRRTQAQRNKADKVAAEAAVRTEALRLKRLNQSIAILPTLQKQLRKSTNLRDQLVAQRALAKEKKILAGLAGQKVGKQRVELGGEMDVQLGDELAESWRTVKPEGNLFKDRFTSLQHRALIEPRSRVTAKKRPLQMKAYEKHAWKRFE